MTVYRVTKNNGETFTVEGTSVEVDGLGTRVKDGDNIVWTTPGMAEVVPVSSIDPPPSGDADPE